MRIDRIDHLVLTVDDVARTSAFYVDVLGTTEATFGQDRTALMFGSSKIDLHQRGRELEPGAAAPTPGRADVCLISDDSLEVVMAELAAIGIAVEEGPVQRTGARGPITNVYIRDPDGNLIELSNHLDGAPRQRT